MPFFQVFCVYFIIFMYINKNKRDKTSLFCKYIQKEVALPAQGGQRDLSNACQFRPLLRAFFNGF